jgi:hypothetical protein
MSGLRWKVRSGRGRGARQREAGVGGKLAATVFFGFFLGMGLLFCFLIGREALRLAETYSWAERRCEILHSQVVRSGGENPYRPELRFRSADAGAPLSGHQIQRRDLAYDSHGAVAARITPYPVGASVPCYASAQGEAVLERGPLWVGFWLLLPGVFVAIGGVGLVATWRPVRRDRLGKPVLAALGARAAKGGAGRALRGFGVVFAAVGGVTFWFVGAVPLGRVYAAQSWSPERCTVEHSSVESHSSDDGTTYSVDILYRWERGRGVERASRYSFFGGSSSGRAGKQAIVRAHPVGAEVACWVHPTRSHEAVLERGLTAHALVALVPAVFLAAGIGMVAAGRRKRRRRAQMRAGAGPSAGLPPDDPVFEVLPLFDPSEGPVALGAQSTRWTRLFGMTLMALFWNGIVSVFAWQAWQSVERGRPDWFLILFLVPFVMAGILFVVGILHALLELRNARPKLVASTRTPRPGERIDLQWGFEGGAGRLERFRLTLRGREHATYQVGTNTRTATETFFEETFVDLPAPACAMGGSASVEVPASTMHSFESAHNKMSWELELRGEIRRWPDLSETYPLVVLPAAPDKWEAR